jgi:predicted MFS family arabinose efflux permease
VRSYLRVLASAVLCYAALGAVLRVLPHQLAADLGAGPIAIGLAVGAPALAGVVSRPLGGRLADRRGPAPVLLAGAVVMAAGIAPATVQTVAAQIGSRLAVGAGEGLMMSAAVLWLLRIAGPERQGRALGHIGLANYAGLAVGPLVADALAGAEHPGRVLSAAGVLPLLGAALAAGIPRPPRASGHGAAGGRARDLAGALARPGAGLLLVTVGYVAVLSFGPEAAVGRGAALVVPVFALTVVAARTLGAGIPDQMGPQRTLAAAAPLAAAGLVGVAFAPGTVTTVAAIVALAAGQALAVPALGILALSRVTPARQGAAAGLFFACFDAGVGLGGLGAGVLARAGGPRGALGGAALAVAIAGPIALVQRRVEPLRPLVD